ncbi:MULTISPECIES: hypothetical protein [unclassified Mesorhizobium]|nr:MULTISPECIES: hypothetical protein [unclassified Mesorhizobium]
MRFFGGEGASLYRASSVRYFTAAAEQGSFRKPGFALGIQVSNNQAAHP